MRPAVRDYHTTMFNDLNDNTFYNFRSAMLSMKGVCETDILRMPVIGSAARFVCLDYVTGYFGQGTINSGIAEFASSQAAQDAFPMRDGQACVNHAAQKIADQCI